MRNGLTVIMDGQYGSTGKGLLAYYYGWKHEYQWATTNSAPNAGHTAYDLQGKKIVTHHLPMAAIADDDMGIYLNAGSLIHIETLEKEMSDYGVDPNRVIIHPSAMIIHREDIEMERSTRSGAALIASTQKGVGAALRRKIARGTCRTAKGHTGLRDLGTIKALDLNAEMDVGLNVLMEIPQGFDLSMNNSPFYPHVTSRDCTLQQGMADALIHPSFLRHTAVCVRTYPIRVGNLIGDNGKVIGFSGPVYDDQEELDWADLNVDPEKTTVTGRVRRVFTWSRQQYLRMLSATRPDTVFLNFCNYMTDPNVVLDGTGDLNALCRNMRIDEMKVLGHPLPHLYGFGPTLKDVHHERL